MLKLACFVAFSLPVAHAWGVLGHQAVGFVAQAFLAPKALSNVQSLLGSEFNESLGVAAPWADTVRSETAFAWSAPNHFLDAEDDPLNGVCDVSESRDCASGFCVLSAISNYTIRIQDTSLSEEQQSEALRFLDHFIGDIGQPLHVEALEVGGNDITAICGGKKTNLHASWDTGMIQTNLDAKFGGSSQTWANSLISRIQSGDLSSLKESWISCSSITAVQNSKRDPMLLDPRAINFPQLECPLIWAQESNALVCSTVFNFSTGEDLCTGTYFNTAIPLIDIQIAKQGFRLAAWLNVIFTGSTNL